MAWWKSLVGQVGAVAVLEFRLHAFLDFFGSAARAELAECEGESLRDSAVFESVCGHALRGESQVDEVVWDRVVVFRVDVRNEF